MKNTLQKIGLWLFAHPSGLDSFILSVATLVLTWQPYLFHQNINLFELGLYLPGIDAVLQGAVPFRDFFYLRGPFELYLPAFLMRIFGENLGVLTAYFYAGTALTLAVCVWLAVRVLPLRIFLYSLFPVLITRTFPRVVFSYWGGMRYAWGLLAVLALILYFKRENKRWLFYGGILTAISGFTSIEIGVCAGFAALACVIFSGRNWSKTVLAYLSGFLTVALPYVVYLSFQGALGAYLDAQWVVVTRMMNVFLRTETTPDTIGKFIIALLNPAGKNFRQMTPFYAYLFLCGYAIYRWRKSRLDPVDKAVLAISAYGVMLYLTGFRTIWQSVFEMALQPEKIVLFYLVSRFFIWLISVPKRKKIGYLLVIAVISSSLGFSISRFSKRFTVFWKDPFRGKATARLDLARVKGMVVPQWQAEDLVKLSDFINNNTREGETVWMYPELGSLHFILQRRWVGKFPIATAAWMEESWYRDYMAELKCLNPRYAIFERKSPRHFEEPCYAEAAKNKFKEQWAYLLANYTLVLSTPSYDIYLRSGGSHG